MSFLLITLSLLTYPITLLVPEEQRAVFAGVYDTDVYFYFRAMLLCLSIFFISVKKLHPGLIVYVVLLFTTVAHTKYPHTALWGTPSYYEGALVLFAYATIASHAKLPVNAVRIAVHIVGILGLLQYVYGSYFDFPPIHFFMPKNLSYTHRIGTYDSTLGHGNHLGLFCALLFPYFLAKKEKLTAATLLILLIASQSRAAWLSCFITTLIQYRQYWFRVLLFSALLMALNAPRAISGLKNVHFPLHDSDFAYRVHIWRHALPMLKHHWLIGSGPGAYALDYPQRTRWKEKVVDRPHNMILSVWYSTGLLSLLALGWVFMSFFARCKDKGMRMGIVGFLICGLFTDSVVSITPYMAAMLGAGLL